MMERGLGREGVVPCIANRDSKAQFVSKNKSKTENVKPLLVSYSLCLTNSSLSLLLWHMPALSDFVCPD